MLQQASLTLSPCAVEGDSSGHVPGVKLMGAGGGESRKGICHLSFARQAKSLSTVESISELGHRTHQQQVSSWDSSSLMMRGMIGILVF